MKTTYEKQNWQIFLVASLAIVIVIYLIANIVDQEDYPLTENWYPTDLGFIITPSIVIVLGITLNLKYKLKGNHGKAWLLFTLAIISWFIGELTYSYDYEYSIDDISTLTSDIFYIIGYPLFFVFALFYLRSRKNMITKKMIVLASLISFVLILPSVYISLDVDEEIDGLTMVLYGIYPVLDGIILAPSLVAVFLFFGGKVNLLWSMILIASILDITADTVYLFTSLEDTYDPSHLVNILWIWPYILYAFGEYSHIKLFKNTS
ncbi:hypothetical protein [Nitrosopumilus ureiphilus]|jgi:hypothetical protein|uniref:Uncharacterized protein n=1 Tax=Nitrosopumilus ureiphilus TaxID=1470067 RepID=A0A7D5RCP9_9ARCH|nr:hypothetical protein [Nitrosopumilus ureiphilus]QLH05843.1 hypothetical protein C5F50_01170 [Nitrosopumilus ureiphilus]